MESLIKDNRAFGTVAEFLEKNITPGSDLSFVSAYFTIYAYKELSEKLDKVNSLRFLFGEPNFVDMGSTLENRKFAIDQNNISIVESNDDITNNDRLNQKNIAKACAEWIKNHVEIRSLTKQNFLHGKLYYIHGAGQNHDDAITGSSNFTTRGLGLSKKSNMELNIIVDSDNAKNELKEWFNALWGDEKITTDVKEEVLKYLTQLYCENSPQKVYLKTLYALFNDYFLTRRDEDIFRGAESLFDSAIWKKLYAFQKDGVKGAIRKLLDYNGCIIADSVGLGKTFEALAVIKYFLIRRERVLVLCPKKLSDNWTVYLKTYNNKNNPLKEDEFDYSVLYHTDMGRLKGKSGTGLDLATFDWGAFDLVVIDESHNFKGNPASKEKNGVLKLNRAAWLMERIIKSGRHTKVLMLSATPVNNGFRDLRNQINFITEGNPAALRESAGIFNTDNILITAQRQFALWIKDKQEKGKDILPISSRFDGSLFKLLDALTIARSRKHILNFYKDEMDHIGQFSKRLPPISVTSEIDSNGTFPTFDEVDEMISDYNLSLYKPSAYLKEGKVDEYAEKTGTPIKKITQVERENFLIDMMKVGFMKRLESSVHSFATSMQNTLDKIDNTIALIEKFKVNKTNGDGEIDAETPEDTGDEEDSEYIVGKKLQFKLADMEVDKWLIDLKKDRESIEELRDISSVITVERDAKLEKLKRLIKNKCNNPINEGNKKIIVFTVFTDTAKYIYENISSELKKELGLESALVTGSEATSTTGETSFFDVLLNFSPRSKERDTNSVYKKSKDIDILIATDCISEGQNLQDCDYLINYDIHWNPVRIIQRFGRIDRIGSRNDVIQLVNFWPTADLNKYLNLKTRVEARMALVDLTATGEDNVLNPAEIENNEIKYRNEQLKALKEVVIDIEDTGAPNLTDFSLEDFRSELMTFIKENERELKTTPCGIYAVVPTPNNDKTPRAAEYTDIQKKVITPGVIFCLKQKDENLKKSKYSDKVNLLDPYFLAYITDDGEVKYNFTCAKQVLDVLRVLCTGQDTPYKDLCDIFNKNTNDGRDMSKIVEKLKAATRDIHEAYQKKSAASLGNSRRATLTLLNKVTENINDYELVTYFVIM